MTTVYIWMFLALMLPNHSKYNAYVENDAIPVVEFSEVLATQQECELTKAQVKELDRTIGKTRILLNECFEITYATRPETGV